MHISTDELMLDTEGHNQIIDITGVLNKKLEQSGFTEGQLTVFVPGSTGGITTIEYEPGLLKDFPEFLDSIIPQNRTYQHDVTWQDGNGYAHLRASLIKPSLAIPFQDRRLLLGIWQQVIFIDFDNRPRSRQLIVQFMGIKE
ncbi:MAG: secondary thiamine-phosphate synthase enzyme YjbQ [Calditrichia bacterium]